MLSALAWAQFSESPLMLTSLVRGVSGMVLRGHLLGLRQGGSYVMELFVVGRLLAR